MLVNNSDNHKHACEFAEESVAFLYGEMDEAQNAKFSLHLKNCSSCADELKAFSSIHSAIQNWKSAEFDVLAAPVIEIPKDLRQKFGAEVSVSNSWLANLRERFSFTLGWVQVGAFAALLISLAFGLYFLSFSGNQELASKKNETKIFTEAAPRSVDKNAVNAKSDSDFQNQGISTESENSKTSDSLTYVQPDEKISRTKKSVPAKVLVNLKNSGVTEKSLKQPLNRKIKAPENYANAAQVNNRNLPKLNNLPEEAEEEDLRLADLFNEIDEG